MKAVVFAFRSLGVAGLAALLRNGFEPVRVYSHDEPDQDQDWYGSVAEFCAAKMLPLAPADINETEFRAELSRLAPEIIFSFGWEKKLPAVLIALAPRGGLNLHLSLLPAYRGPHPVNWALIRDERETGVSLHRITEKLNAGDLVGQVPVWIEKADDVHRLYHKLVTAGAGLLDQLLPGIKAGELEAHPQELSSGSYFGDWTDEDRRIVWSQSSFEIYNRVRGLTRPFPGAYCYFQGEKMTVWRAEPDDSPGVLYPGELDEEDDKLLVGARYGSVRLIELEWKGENLREPEIARALSPHWRTRFE